MAQVQYRIRERYGVTIFRRFFEAIVERCQDDGLIWGKELYGDATLVKANADRDKMLPRFAVEAHLRRLFGEAYQPPAAAEDPVPLTGTTTTATTGIGQSTDHPVLQIGADLPPERQAKLLAHQQGQQGWYARNCEPDRIRTHSWMSRRILGA
jgi:hypothetical protein